MAAPGLTVRTLRSLLGVVGKDATVRGALRNPLALSGFVVPSAFAAGGLIGRPLAETISEGITGAETTRNREALESGMQTYASQFAEKLRKNREAAADAWRGY